jgi:hypothetical protein
MKWGDFAPLKDHWNETRGLPWSDRLRHQKEEKFVDERARVYARGSPWGLEKHRFLTVDVQAKGGRHFWCCVRQWGYGGVSRKLFFGKALSWEEVKQIQKTWFVPDINVAIDSAFATAEVYQQVVNSGYKWKAVRGEDKPYFIVPGPGNTSIKSQWDVSPVDPAIGTRDAGRVRPIPLYRFSKPGTLDRLFLMRYGELGDWQINSEVDDEPYAHEYKLQVTAWDRRYRTNSKGEEIAEWYQKRPDDHATDCERMQIACADITGLLRPPAEGELPFA